MSENDSNTEVGKRRAAANQFLRDAVDNLDKAIEAFGGWWPEDSDCAYTVGALMSAAGIIEGQTLAFHERRQRYINERLSAYMARLDEERQQSAIERVKAPTVSAVEQGR